MYVIFVSFPVFNTHLFYVFLIHVSNTLHREEQYTMWGNVTISRNGALTSLIGLGLSSVICGGSKGAGVCC